MYCRHCGVEIADKAIICPKCGCQQEQIQMAQNSATVVDDGNIGWAFLGFFLPVIGLILFLAWNDTKPKTAKVVGKGALASLIVQVAVAIIGTIFGVSLLGAIFAAL